MKVKEESQNSWLKAQHSETKIMASGPITPWLIDGGNSGNSVRLYFLGLQKSLQMVIAAVELKDAYSLEGKL